MNSLFSTNNICFFFFINLGACLSMMPLASAQSSVIDRVEKAKNSIVTIESQKLEFAKDPGGQTALTPDGRNRERDKQSNCLGWT